MVDRDQRLVRGHRQRLGRHQTDHHAADQTGARRRRNRIDLIERHAGIGQRGRDHRRQPLGMGARGDLGNDAAIGAVHVVLRGDALGENDAFAGHKRGGRLVARRFYAENYPHPGFP